jgi:hypothetical protein
MTMHRGAAALAGTAGRGLRRDDLLQERRLDRNFAGEGAAVSGNQWDRDGDLITAFIETFKGIVVVASRVCFQSAARTTGSRRGA